MLIWFLVAAMAADFSVFDDGSAWKELATRDKDGMTVLVRHRMAGEVNCFEGSTTTEADAEALIAAATDIPGAPSWSNEPLPLSKVLGREGDAVRYVQHVDIPDWTLVHDRFWVLSGTTATEADGTRRFRWTRVDAAEAYPELHAQLTGPEVKAVEVPVNWGQWSFRPAGQGTSEIHYQVCTDAGGVIPSWLQRVTTRTTLPDVVISLVGEARRRAGG